MPLLLTLTELIPFFLPQIFVKDNQGDEEVTRLDKIDLIGISVDQTNMSDVRFSFSSECYRG